MKSTQELEHQIQQSQTPSLLMGISSRRTSFSCPTAA